MADAFSLYQLNRLLRDAIKGCFPDRYWMHAELSEVHENYSSGHCYLEFIEKDSRAEQTVAKARGVIWSSVYRLLKPYFEKSTGQPFSAGIKVLVEVGVEFHELYGYSLTVFDIDPVYTVGDMTRRRREIMQQLTDEGVVDLNKELPWPELPQRVAVVSSASAAGYGDFCDQLLRNKNGYCFYPVLFPAVMQGQQAEQSVIGALEQIYDRAGLFDVVVIIRGGGATSDLNCFDSYLLAQHITQFPLPVVTGIGHDRDDTVIDLVAHFRAKTPTAAAEYLISSTDESYTRLLRLQQEMDRLCRMRIEHQRLLLEKWQSLIPQLVHRRTEQQASVLTQIGAISTQAVRYRMQKEQQRLEHVEQVIRLTSPDRLLKKGYTLTLKMGKVVRSVEELTVGDRVTTLFGDGRACARIEEIKEKK